MNTSFSREFMPFDGSFYFEVNDNTFQLTEVEYYVWMAKRCGEVISQECGLNGKHALDHELMPLMRQYMQKGHELCNQQGLTYWEVFDKITAWFRKVVKNG